MIVEFPLGLDEGVTRLDIDPDKILTAAVGKLKDVVIVGFDDAGEFYFASSQSSGPESLWLLAMAQKKLIDIGVGYD